jgi:hypothetical protein
MLNPEPIDFRPLIAALEKAQEKQTLAEQRLELELAITASELNPEPNEFCELLWGIEAIAEIDFEARSWQGAEEFEA